MNRLSGRGKSEKTKRDNEQRDKEGVGHSARRACFAHRDYYSRFSPTAELVHRLGEFMRGGYSLRIIFEIPDRLL